MERLLVTLQLPDSDPAPPRRRIVSAIKWIGSIVVFASYLKMKCLWVCSVLSIWKSNIYILSCLLHDVDSVDLFSWGAGVTIFKYLSTSLFKSSSRLKPTPKTASIWYHLCLFTYTSQNKSGTWKWPLGKGDSYWKPSFQGSMLNFGGVGWTPKTCDFNHLSPGFLFPPSTANPHSRIHLKLEDHKGLALRILHHACCLWTNKKLVLWG